CSPVMDVVSFAMVLAASESRLASTYQMSLLPTCLAVASATSPRTMGFCSRYTVLPWSHSISIPPTICGFIGQDWPDSSCSTDLDRSGAPGTPGVYRAYRVRISNPDDAPRIDESLLEAVL